MQKCKKVVHWESLISNLCKSLFNRSCEFTEKAVLGSTHPSEGYTWRALKLWQILQSSSLFPDNFVMYFFNHLQFNWYSKGSGLIPYSSQYKRLISKWTKTANPCRGQPLCMCIRPNNAVAIQTKSGVVKKSIASWMQNCNIGRW